MTGLLHWFKFCEFYASVYLLCFSNFRFLQFCVARMDSLSSKKLQETYAAELSDGPLSQLTSPHYLHKALVAKGVKITEETCKQWWSKYRKPPNAVAIPTAKVLHESYGARVSYLAKDYNTAYRLCKRLLEEDPPLSVTDAVAKEWLKKYATDKEVTEIQSSGHLESWCGDKIRAEMPSSITDGSGFQVRLDGSLADSFFSKRIVANTGASWDHFFSLVAIASFDSF